MRNILAFVLSLSANVAAFAVDGGMVSFVDKDVQLIHVGKSQSLQKGDKIAWGDTVVLGAGGKLQISLGEQKIFLFGKSKIVLKQSMVTGVGMLELSEGQVRVKTPRMPPTFTGEPVTLVKTPTAIVGVRGTEFWVSSATTGESEVIGIEKNVDLATVDGKSHVTIEPGQWSAVGGKYGKTIKTPVPTDEEKMKQIKNNLEFH